MKLKRERTPLTRLDTLDAAERDSLESVYITSVEDLLGTMYSSPDGLASTLGVSRNRLDELQHEAESVLDSSVLDALAEQAQKSYYVGGISSAARMAKRSSAR